MEAVLDNFESAPIDEKLRSVLAFLQKLTVNPSQVTPEDIATMRSSGVSEKAISEAIYVCFAFSVMDRLADALDFDIPSPKHFKTGGRFLYRMGYKAASLRG